MRLIDYFDRGAGLHPDRHCRHDGTQGWTSAEVHARTYRVANGVLAVGLGRGDKAAVGGFNVFPSEVEQVLGSHPAVQDARSSACPARNGARP